MPADVQQTAAAPPPADKKAPASQNLPPLLVFGGVTPVSFLSAAANVAIPQQADGNPPQFAAALTGPDAAVTGPANPPTIPGPALPAGMQPRDGALNNSNQPQNVSVSAPATSSTANLQPAIPNELTFAARIQQAQSANPSTLSAEMAAASLVSAAKKTDGGDGARDASQSGSNLLSQAAIAAFERNTEAAFTEQSHPSAEPTRAAEAQTVQVETPPKATAPLKDISLQVTQPGAEKVDVRVTQQAGEVRVAVRTGDVDLAHGLRQGLSDLAGRLEENGYRAETWRPSGSTTPVANAEEAHNTPGNSRHADAQAQPGWSQQDGGRRNQNQSNQPRWVEEMESSLTGGDQNPGGTYGFGN